MDEITLAQRRFDRFGITTSIDNKGHSGITWNAFVKIKEKYNLQGRVLDVGCSRGYHIEAMRKLGLEAYGMDYDGPSVLAMANPLITCGDMHDIPFPDEYWDNVFASHVLEHSPSPYLAIKEMIRVLKYNGYLFISIPKHAPPWVTIIEHFSVLTPEQFQGLINKFDNAMIIECFETKTEGVLSKDESQIFLVQKVRK